jgi:hypothetical protein
MDATDTAMAAGADTLPQVQVQREAEVRIEHGADIHF